MHKKKGAENEEISESGTWRSWWRWRVYD